MNTSGVTFGCRNQFIREFILFVFIFIYWRMNKVIIMFKDDFIQIAMSNEYSAL